MMDGWRCCPGCEGSAVIALALLRHCLLAMSSCEGRGLQVMCGFNDPLQVCHRAVGIPGCNAVRQDALYGDTDLKAIGL